MADDLDTGRLALLQQFLAQDHRPPENAFVERRATGGTDAASLPLIKSYGGGTAEGFDAAAKMMTKTDLDKLMAYAQAPPTAQNRSFGWDKRLRDCVRSYTNYLRKFHPDVPEDSYWAMDTVEKHAIGYLVMRTVTTKGVDGKYIKARSLLSWADGLINCILQFTTKSSIDRTFSGSQLIGQKQMGFRIHAKVQEMINEMKLSKALRQKTTIDANDFRIMVQHILYETRFNGPRRQVAIRDLGTFSRMGATALRPSSVAAANADYRDRGFYLKLRDIAIFREAHVAWRIRIRNPPMKGHITSGLDLNMEYNLYPVADAEDLFNCPSTYDLVALLDRGALYYRTLEELCAATEYQILIREEMLDEPFQLAANPKGEGYAADRRAALASSITASIQRIARGAGMGRVVSYSFRGGQGNRAARISTNETAGILFGHEEYQTTFSRNYSTTVSEIDVVALMNGKLGYVPTDRIRTKDQSKFSCGVMAILGKSFFNESKSMKKPRPPGHQGEFVRLTAEEREAAEDPELRRQFDNAMGQLWDIYEGAARYKRVASNRNDLMKNCLLKGGYRKADVDERYKNTQLTLKALNARSQNALRKARTVKGRVIQKEAQAVQHSTEEHTAARQALEDGAQSFISNFLASEPGPSTRRRLQVPAHQPPNGSATMASAAIVTTASATTAAAVATASAPVAAAAATAERVDMPDEAPMANVDTRVEDVFPAEDAEVDDVVSEDGTWNPLREHNLRGLFLSSEDLASLRAVFKDPILPPEPPADVDDDEELATSDLVAVDNPDDPAIDGALPPSIITDPIHVVRREWMELLLAPVLLHRAGLPYPGQEDRFKCDVCGKKSKDAYGAREHRERVHNDWQTLCKTAKCGKIWQCLACSRPTRLVKFQEKSELVDHFLKHCRNKERNAEWHAADEASEKLYNRRMYEKNAREASATAEDLARAKARVTTDSLKAAGMSDEMLDEFFHTSNEWIRLVHDPAAAAASGETNPIGSTDVNLDIDLDQELLAVLIPSGL